MANNWESYLTKNANKKKYFVKWYMESDKSEENYNKEVKGICCVNYQTAMEVWLLENEVQSAIKCYLKNKKTLDVINIYNKMLENALGGDVASAKWIMDFDKTGFFGTEEKSEIDKLIDNLNVV